MAKKSLKPMPDFFVLDDPEVEKRLCKVIADFQGPATQLESALGALILGQHMGTRALKMIHSPSTYRKYEALLGIKYEDFCEERTRLSVKLIGIKIADKIGAFWDVVMGRHKVEKKGWMEGPDAGDSSDA